MKSFFMIGYLFVASLAFAQNISSQQNLVAGNTEFAINLYHQLRGQSGNLFFSPYSISSALAMTYAGAKEQTASQMKEVLKFSLPNDILHKTFFSLNAELNRPGDEYELAVANALWGQKDYKFRQEYLEFIEKNYLAPLTLVDFVGGRESACGRINDWVTEKTKKRITNIIDPRTIDKLTRLILTNAIYFKGKWQNEFDKGSTREAKFFTRGGAVNALMMSNQGHFRYYEKNQELQIVELPYRGTLAMLILLPGEKVNFQAFEKSLNAGELTNLLGQLSAEEVTVKMPKFKFETKYFMSNDLKAMGMRDAFNMSDANFSGMYEPGALPLYISQVIHKAYVKVNECGTEAAAATAVVGYGQGALHPQPKYFNANHPFLFLIRDNVSGAILFLGRFQNPTGTAISAADDCPGTAPTLGVDRSSGVSLSPLLSAVDNNSVEDVKALLEKGASPNQKFSDGKTAVELARERSAKEIVDLLESALIRHGAK